MADCTLVLNVAIMLIVILALADFEPATSMPLSRSDVVRSEALNRSCSGSSSCSNRSISSDTSPPKDIKPLSTANRQSITGTQNTDMTNQLTVLPEDPKISTTPGLFDESTPTNKGIPLPDDFPKEIISYIIGQSITPPSNHTTSPPKKLSFNDCIILFSILCLFAGITITSCVLYMVINRRRIKRDFIDNDAEADSSSDVSADDQSLEPQNQDEAINNRDLLPLQSIQAYPPMRNSNTHVPIKMQHANGHIFDDHFSESDFRTPTLPLMKFDFLDNLPYSDFQGDAENSPFEQEPMSNFLDDHLAITNRAPKFEAFQTPQTVRLFDINSNSCKIADPREYPGVNKSRKNSGSSIRSACDEMFLQGGADANFYRDEIFEGGAVGGTTDWRAPPDWFPESRKSSASSSEFDYYLHIDDSKYKLINKKQCPPQLPQPPPPEPRKPARKRQISRRSGLAHIECAQRKIWNNGRRNSPPKNEKLLRKLEKLLGMEMSKRARKSSIDMLRNGIPEEDLSDTTEAVRKDSGVADLEQRWACISNGRNSDNEDNQDSDHSSQDIT